MEFFFIVSGYLMMKKIHSSDINATTYTVNHARKLYPQYMPALILITAYSLAVIFYKGIAIKHNILTVCISFVQESLFLHEVKLTIGTRLLGQAWYISAMLIVGFFMFACLKRWKKKIVLTIFFAISVLFMILSYIKYGSFHLNIQNISIKGFGLYLGLIRGFAEMTLGCIAFEASKRIPVKLGQTQIIAAKIVHVIMLLIVLAITCFSFVPDCDFLMISCCFVMVVLTFSGLTFFAEAYRRIPIKKIEEFSLVIYLNYLIVRRILFEVMKIYNIFIYFFACILITIFMIAFINYIKIHVDKRMNKIGNKELQI